MINVYAWEWNLNWQWPNEYKYNHYEEWYKAQKHKRTSNQMQARAQNCKLNLILISNHRPHEQAKRQIVFFPYSHY